MMLTLRSKLSGMTKSLSRLKGYIAPLSTISVLNETKVLFLQQRQYVDVPLQMTHRHFTTTPVVTFSTPSENIMYDHEFMYLPSWRKIPAKMVQSVTAHEYHLEVTFYSPRNENDIHLESQQSTCMFAYHWLRDNCRCTECFNHSSLNKIHKLTTTSHLLHSAAVSEDGRLVVLKWQDGHESLMPVKYLSFHYIESQKPRTDPVIDAARELWGSNVSENQLKRFAFDDILNDDKVLLDWLMDLRVLGVTLIQNAPLTTGQLDTLSKRVAYLRPTCFGKTFQVQVKADASHVAYSGGPLPLHTDTTYYMKPVGIQLFHCITKSSQGGETILSDGFRAAEILRQSDPECFDILTKVEWEYYDVGYDYLGQHHMQARHPVIRLDSRGRLEQIVFSTHGRGSRMDMTASEVSYAYEALRKYISLINSQENVFTYGLNQGEILVFDNFRVLHGRLNIDSGTARHLEGAYLDWDEVCSKTRALQSQFSS